MTAADIISGRHGQWAIEQSLAPFIAVINSEAIWHWKRSSLIIVVRNSVEWLSNSFFWFTFYFYYFIIRALVTETGRLHNRFITVQVYGMCSFFQHHLSLLKSCVTHLMIWRITTTLLVLLTVERVFSYLHSTQRLFHAVCYCCSFH